MHKKNVYVIGLMSGTSLDGLDVVYVKFDTSNYENYTILHSCTYSYSNEWSEKLKNGIHTTKEALDHLDIDFGRYLGSTVNLFRRKFEISKVDFIASHGHTAVSYTHLSVSVVTPVAWQSSYVGKG